MSTIDMLVGGKAEQLLRSWPNRVARLAAALEASCFSLDFLRSGTCAQET